MVSGAVVFLAACVMCLLGSPCPTQKQSVKQAARESLSDPNHQISRCSPSKNTKAPTESCGCNSSLNPTSIRFYSEAQAGWINPATFAAAVKQQDLPQRV